MIDKATHKKESRRQVSIISWRPLSNRACAANAHGLPMCFWNVWTYLINLFSVSVSLYRSFPYTLNSLNFNGSFMLTFLSPFSCPRTSLGVDTLFFYVFPWFAFLRRHIVRVHKVIPLRSAYFHKFLRYYEYVWLLITLFILSLRL